MITRLFLAHPRSVGESYGAHLGFASIFAAQLFAAGAAAAAHALFPFAFKTTASALIARMHHRLERRASVSTEQAAHRAAGMRIEAAGAASR